MSYIDPRTPYFEAARMADEDGVLVLDDVNKIHAVLDLAGIPRGKLPPAPVSKPGGPDDVGPDGINLIMQFEGCAKLLPNGTYMAYPDPGTGNAPWTIGWGSTRGFDGQPIAPGTVWTQTQCDRKLEIDLAEYADEVAVAIGNAPTTQAQFDAMVSFHYNTGAIGRATLTKRHKARDYEGAANEFKRWNKAGGRVMKGLVRRRRSEEELYRRKA